MVGKRLKISRKEGCEGWRRVLKNCLTSKHQIEFKSKFTLKNSEYSTGAKNVTYIQTNKKINKKEIRYLCFMMKL